MCVLFSVSGGSSRGTQQGEVPPGGGQNAALQGKHVHPLGVHAGSTTITLKHQASHHLPGTHTLCLSVCLMMYSIFCH